MTEKSAGSARRARVDSGSLNGSTTGDIDGAKSRGAKIIGSCWSPPANCKSNNSTQNGGHTNTSCYDSWSTTITGGTAPASMVPNVTSATDNLKAGTAVPVTGGAFMATLASKTVTTFVGM